MNISVVLHVLDELNINDYKYPILIFNTIPYPKVYFMLMLKLNLSLYLQKNVLLDSMGICLKSLLLNDITCMFSIDFGHTYCPTILFSVFRMFYNPFHVFTSC